MGHEIEGGELTFLAMTCKSILEPRLEDYYMPSSSDESEGSSFDMLSECDL